MSLKIRGIATFDINVHFCWCLLWNSVTILRMKQNRKNVKEIRKFHNLMQGAPWLKRFNFQGVHPGFRRLKFRVHPGKFYILDASKIMQLNLPRFSSSAFEMHSTFCSSTFRMRSGFWSLKIRVSPKVCSLIFRVHPGFWSINTRVHPTFCSLHSGWNLVCPIFCNLKFRVHPIFGSFKLRVHPILV